MIQDLFNNDFQCKLTALKLTMSSFTEKYGFDWFTEYGSIDPCRYNLHLFDPETKTEKTYVLDLKTDKPFIPDVLEPIMNDFLKIVEEKSKEKKMKKLFISCPMKGRTEENIRSSMEKMHKIAEIVFGEELEVIPSYIEDNPPKDSKEAVWYLGESIKKMAEADYFIGINYHACWQGCNIEGDIAKIYNIPHTFVNTSDIMPDCLEVEKEYYEKSYEMKSECHEAADR